MMTPTTAAIAEMPALLNLVCFRSARVANPIAQINANTLGSEVSSSTVVLLLKPISMIKVGKKCEYEMEAVVDICRHAKSHTRTSFAV
jgi:hypothetical protein